MPKYFSDVLCNATMLLGDLTDDEADFLALIVEAVCLQMDQKLRKDADPKEYNFAYIPACTMLSISYYRSIDNKNLSSFTAGTVSLSFQENNSTLVAMAEKLMAPWLQIAPVFRGVRA